MRNKTIYGDTCISPDKQARLQKDRNERVTAPWIYETFYTRCLATSRPCALDNEYYNQHARRRCVLRPTTKGILASEKSKCKIRN